MVSVKLHKNGGITTITAEKGENLLKIIQRSGTDFYAPCGGNGTCGKCRVNILNEGVVTSCLYLVNKDIEVILPDASPVIQAKGKVVWSHLTPFPVDESLRYDLGIEFVEIEENDKRLVLEYVLRQLNDGNN